MKIDLEVSNSFTLELLSGAVYRIRENGSGKLTIMPCRDNDTIEVSGRDGMKITKLGSCREVILD